MDDYIGNAYFDAGLLGNATLMPNLQGFWRFFLRNRSMRVTPRQIETVRMLVHRHFGDDAEVWLFGSRVDDCKKGGDYDFLIETSFEQSDAIIEHKIALIAELQSSGPFEDEKIDCVLKRRSSSFEIPIYAIAKKEGVLL